MKKYNLSMIKEIMNIMDNDEFIKKLEEYLYYYQDDLIAIKIYLGKLAKLNQLEKCENYIDIKLSKRIVDTDLRTYLIIKKFSILIILGKYQDAYNLCMEENYMLYKNIPRLDVIECYLCKKCNLPFNKEKRYIFNQIFNYSEEIAIEHIINRHQNNIENSGIFNENVDIIDFINLIKDNINITNARLVDFIFNEYIFKYNGVGIDKNGVNVNFVKIICLKDNNEIITMYPINEKAIKDGINCVDITPKVTNTYTNKLVKKRESQTDKFIKKFGYR